jgi:hypothetical protein
MNTVFAKQTKNTPESPWEVWTDKCGVVECYKWGLTFERAVELAEGMMSALNADGVIYRNGAPWIRKSF